MNNKQVALWVCMICIVIGIVTSLSCLPCNNPSTGEPFDECAPLPDGCQPGYTPCGCCPKCRLKEGETCSGIKVKCEKGLFCTGRGRRLKYVPWWARFKGKCLPSAEGPTKPLRPSDPDA